jgi:hypothetical protein
MALQTRISNAAAIACVNAVVDLLDVGGAGYVEIRSGTQPADVDTAAAGTVLATITLNNPAFGAAADDTGSAKADANTTPALTDSSADNTGTAAWFRAYNNGGTGVIDGSVGVGATYDMNIDNTSISSGQSVTITSWSVSMSETEA